MKENEVNKDIYNIFKSDFLDQVAKGEATAGFQEAYAVTELIASHIKNYSYKVYHGGGYSPDGNPVLKFDVICKFRVCQMILHF